MTSWDAHGLLNGLPQAALIFDADNHCVAENPAAWELLGNDLKLIKQNGWAAASTLLNGSPNGERVADDARKAALEGKHPVRFHALRSGEFMTCWASAMPNDFTLITLERRDWSAMSELLGRFREEVEGSVKASLGHLDLVRQMLKQDPDETTEHFNRRAGNFLTLITTHGQRIQRLAHLMARLERIRTGKMQETAQAESRRIPLASFVEDFLETLDEATLLDPESEQQDCRARVQVIIPNSVVVAASPVRLTYVLQDILRNAIMYSMKATPVRIVGTMSGQSAQLDISDEGYGVRAKEYERVFAPFQRARQPQIIGEFGYGISLYLCKHEVEAMNGKMWFQSDEGNGTTMHIKLPLWQGDAAASSSSSRSTLA